MKLIPMKFKDYRWEHNPRELVFECGSDVKELKVPYGKARVQNMGRKNMTVKGEGELYGEDCMEQFSRLYSLFKQGGAGVLSIPKLKPIYAVFESVKIIGEPKPDILTYSFVFRELMELEKSEPPTSYTVKAGESLWDISYSLDIPIDALVKLNPQIKRPDEPEAGSTVILC